MLDPRLPDGSFWVFGYGSLIHRPDLPFGERVPVRLTGWVRRFWQGSHDHRGVPHAPGRVVTLVEDETGLCDGVAYRVPAGDAEAVLARLDHREKNGYARRELALTPHGGGGTIHALTYLATPANPAWLGPAPSWEIAAQIHRSRGPSGHNRDYLLELAAALRALGAEDAHVFELEAHLHRLLAGAPERARAASERPGRRSPGAPGQNQPA